ncbi:hypothetical protein CVT26_003254 [Gymnopilus dilepis]|uniref:Uncharacterized protein n=1 Tax=Gymnopilus dilepis TaxID=231916 RepID=A0A409X9X1_9AGAR|nr:hypothetical protein CVT26_003254 [Gymnopilus dilepis]
MALVPLKLSESDERSSGTCPLGLNIVRTAVPGLGVCAITLRICLYPPPTQGVLEAGSLPIYAPV